MKGGETAPRLFKVVAVTNWNKTLPGWNKKEFNETVEETVPEVRESEYLPEDALKASYTTKIK